MLKLNKLRFNFSNINNQLKNVSETQQNKKLVKLQSGYGGVNNFIQQRITIGKQDIKHYKQNLPSLTRMRQMKSRQCAVKLYINHNEWKSQYIYAFMNYQKLGFIPISNYTLLKFASEYYHVNKKPLSQQFPIMNFAKPIQQPAVLHGIKQIINYLYANQLVVNKIQNDQTRFQPLKKFIDQNIVTNLQMLFWHPTLTLHSLFHIHLASYKGASQNYDIFITIYKNIAKVVKTIPKNLYKIISNKKKYYQSKSNLQKNLKQIIIILNNQQFIGGKKPNHLDFYLFAILNTKINVQYFQEFLRNSIGPQFWMWMYRMRCLTKYDRDRLTII